MNDKWMHNVREGPAAIVAGQLLEQLASLEVPDENSISDLAKVRRQAERAAWVIGNCDPYLAPQPALDSAHQHLTNATTAAIAFQTAPDAAQLAAAMKSTEAALVALSGLVLPVESIAPAEAIANLGQTVSEQLARTSALMTETVGQLEAKVFAVDQQRVSAETQNADLLARLDLLRTEIEAMRASTTNLTTQWQTSFTDEQTARGEQFRTLLEEQRTQGATSLTTLDTATKASITKVEADVAAAVARIDAQKAKAEEIVGIISDEALIGDASKRANEDKKAALFWSFGAVVVGLVAVLIAIIAVAKHSSDDADWVGFGLKALAVLAVGGVSGYAARQAGEHRRAQRDLEHMAVQLAAIKPYLRDMDETKRDEVLKDLSPSLFGPRVSVVPTSDGADLAPGTLQLVQVLVKALQAK